MSKINAGRLENDDPAATPHAHSSARPNDMVDPARMRLGDARRLAQNRDLNTLKRSQAMSGNPLVGAPMAPTGAATDGGLRRCNTACQPRSSLLALSSVLSEPNVCECIINGFSPESSSSHDPQSKDHSLVCSCGPPLQRNHGTCPTLRSYKCGIHGGRLLQADATRARFCSAIFRTSHSTQPPGLVLIAIRFGVGT